MTLSHELEEIEENERLRTEKLLPLKCMQLMLEPENLPKLFTSLFSR